MKCVVAGYSNRSCDRLDKIVARIFPDSDIAQQFRLGRQKSMYFATYGITPYVKSLLKPQLAKSDIKKVLTVLLKVVRWMLFCVIGVMKIRKLKLGMSFKVKN